MMFGRNGIFGIGNSWKKVAKQESSKKNVVLTKVTALRNGPECEQSSRHPTAAGASNDNPTPRTDGGADPPKPGYHNVFSGLAGRKGSANCTVLKLYKSESEDSGAEFPSGANSPLTPSGSEQSLVIHRRVSSCDSGMALSITSISPAVQHLPPASPCANSGAACIKEDREDLDAAAEVGEQPRASTSWTKDHRSSSHFSPSPPPADARAKRPRRVSLVEIVIADAGSLPVAKGGMTERRDAATQLDHQPLTRGQSNQSLDKYMEKCCRLSEANQDKTVDRSSGLGYLEHICQLIETIGHLQEQNKQLQKHVWVMEKILKVNKLKEEFFLNHCSCGAAGVYHTLSNLPGLHSDSSRPHSCQRSPLILESTAQNLRCQGEEADPVARVWLRKSACKEMGRSIEIEMKQGLDGTRSLNCSHQGFQEVKVPPGEKVKVLLRNCSLKNQDKAREVSNFIKRSYTQLYRTDAGAYDSQMKETNSTCASGSTANYDWDNSH
ncbi:uncharacterized protein LOC144600868 isoform X2 [Rhinoraja longicauda]